MFDTIRTLETLKEGADIHIFYHSSFGHSRRWSVKFEKEHDGTRLEIKVTGDTLDECIGHLNHKFRKAVGQGLKELDLPILEYQPPAPEELEEMTVRAEQDLHEQSDDDDEIPS